MSSKVDKFVRYRKPQIRDDDPKEDMISIETMGQGSSSSMMTSFLFKSSSSSKSDTEKYKLLEAFDPEDSTDSEDEVEFESKKDDHDEDDKLIQDDRVSFAQPEQESFWSITLQIFLPFLVAGLGMVGAGIVLDIVQHWQVFETVNELFILVPALLGLKGNLEMTLASRLSTQVGFPKCVEAHDIDSNLDEHKCFCHFRPTLDI